MKRLRCSLLMVLAGFFLLVAGPVPAADFGFGIPDMVEEKVDELDEKVRNYKARQPQLDRFSSVAPQFLPDSDTSDFIVSSAIARDEARVYIIGDYNPPGEEEIRLFQLDGEGKNLSSIRIESGAGGTADTFHQLSVAPGGEVDVLTEIHSDSGSIGLFFRRVGNNNLSPTPTFSGFPFIFAGADTTVSVNTFSYDADENIYVSGDSGVFSISPEGSQAFGLTRWSNKYLNEFRVPEDSLVTRGNSIYVASHEGPSPSVGQDTVVLAKIDSDSAFEASDTIVHDFGPSGNFNAEMRLLAGQDNLYLHYQQDRSGTDALFKYDYDLNRVESASYDLDGDPHHFEPTVVGNDYLYAGSDRGAVIRFDHSNFPASVSSSDSITISDSAVQVNLQGNAGELYAGTPVNAEGSVIAISSDFNDTQPLGTGTDDLVLPVDDQFARAVWYGGGFDGLGGFLGIVFGGRSITWTNGGISAPAFQSSELGNSAWPHEDANNQRQRRQQ